MLPGRISGMKELGAEAQPNVQVASAVQEDGLATLMTQLDRGLEDAGRRRGAADVITHFCADTDLDFQEHTSDLLAVGFWGVGGFCLGFKGKPFRRQQACPAWAEGYLRRWLSRRPLVASGRLYCTSTHQALCNTGVMKPAQLP